MIESLVEQIDALLPQTQCRQCGFSGCNPYAAAIARGEADINQCPPGGAETIGDLARLLGIAPKPLNTAHGITKPRAVAFIDESLCIGCTLCIQACPVDAILGAAKQMHTVIAAECTGCELCIPPCPVDCIWMLPDAGQSQSARNGNEDNSHQIRLAAADRARARFEFRNFRLAREQTERAERIAARQAAARSAAGNGNAASTTNRDAKKAAIQAAIERVRAKRAAIAAVNSGQQSPSGAAAPAEAAPGQCVSESD